MPLSPTAEQKLRELSEELGGFTLFGLLVNTETGEVGPYSSHGIEPGAIIGFLQQASQELIEQAETGELIALGEDHGTARTTTEEPLIFGGKSDTSRTASGYDHIVRQRGTTLVH